MNRLGPGRLSRGDQCARRQREAQRGQCLFPGTRQQLDGAIVECPSLSKLNGREIKDAERSYLQSLHRLGKRRMPDL